MILKTRDGREVEVTEIDYGTDPVDSYIVCAYYVDELDDDKALVSEDVLDELQEDYANDIQDAWFDHQVGRADFYDAD